jgi:pimeloyl-ACP methyl ester carboxylesterase
MILGSGARDRHYGGTGPAIGKHFARHGFACLAWDKPGVGQSTGDFNAQSFRDRAEEALAAVAFLRARKDIRADQIGLWGHSQGGIVAPLAAALSPKTAFVIEVAGWQGPAWRQDQVRVEAELRADGFADEIVAKASAFARERMDLIRGTEPFEELDRKQQAVKSEAWFEYVHYCDRRLFESARRAVQSDPGSSWDRVHCPVLVIFGDKDSSSGPAEPHVAIIRRGLKKAGNNDITVKLFANADHSLCKSKTGGRKEALERSKSKKPGADPEFVDGYLETMTTWLEKRCRP